MEIENLRLQDEIDNFKKTALNMFYPIGSYYETSDSSFDPNVSFGGTWEEMHDGTTLISEGAYWNTTAAQPGEKIGNVQTWLTMNQIPAHTHSFSAITNSTGSHAHTIKITTSNNGAHSHSYNGTTSSNGIHDHAVTNGATGENKSSVIATDAGSHGTFGARIETLNTSDYKYTNSTMKQNGAHTHTYSGTTGSSGGHTHTVSGNSGSTGAHTHTVSGTTGSAGQSSVTPVNLYQPSLVVCRWHRTA